MVIRTFRKDWIDAKQVVRLKKIAAGLQARKPRCFLRCLGFREDESCFYLLEEQPANPQTLLELALDCLASGQLQRLGEALASIFGAFKDYPTAEAKKHYLTCYFAHPGNFLFEDADPARLRVRALDHTFCLESFEATPPSLLHVASAHQTYFLPSTSLLEKEVPQRDVADFFLCQFLAFLERGVFPNQKNKISDVIELLPNAEIHATEQHRQAKEAKQQLEGTLRARVVEKSQQLQAMVVMSLIDELVGEFVLHNSYIVKRSAALTETVKLLNLEQPPSVDKRELQALVEFSDCELKQLQPTALHEMKAVLKQTVDPVLFLSRVTSLWRLECRNILEVGLQQLAKHVREEAIWTAAREHSLKHHWDDISKHLRNGDGGVGNEDKLIADILKNVNKIL